MAQGCWLVVAVCATSYSWTTGPHRGAMESPQTAAGTRDPATPIRTFNMKLDQKVHGGSSTGGMLLAPPGEGDWWCCSRVLVVPAHKHEVLGQPGEI